MQSEFKVANRIRMNLLPHFFSSLQGSAEFDIHALVKPAGLVGGDLYDFFQIDEEHLFFAIGDVSGKGVRAAIYMAIIRKLLGGNARQGLSPESLLTALNAKLCRRTETHMFVTLFCGILNTRTGIVEYACAGHNPPLLLRKKKAEYLEVNGETILGVFNGVEYSHHRFVLQPGESLILYTDGITEARNESREFFSRERFQEETSSLQGLSPREVLTRVLEKVRSFRGDAPQSDDIAMLMVRFNGARKNSGSTATDWK